MARAESSLLSFREELVDNLVQDHFADRNDRYKIFWPNLCCIEDVEVKTVLLSIRNDLETKRPLWRSSVLDGFFKVLAMEVWQYAAPFPVNIDPDGSNMILTRILSTDLQSLVPHQAVNTKLGQPVELHEEPLVLGIDQGVGIDPETLHHAEGTWDATVRHSPHHHV